MQLRQTHENTEYIRAMFPCPSLNKASGSRMLVSLWSVSHEISPYFIPTNRGRLEQTLEEITKEIWY